jgi:ABC-2 type transport system permease protein
LKDTVLFKTIIRHEWRTLRSDRSAWVVLVIFGVLIECAIFNVSTTLRRQQAAEKQTAIEEENKFARMRDEALRIELEAASRGEHPPKFQAEAKYWDKPGPRDSVFVGAWNAPRIVPPSSPLTVLAVGQSDLVPNSYKVGLDGRLEWNARNRVAQQLENPLLLKFSRFDLAFVILYVYPLLILAVSYNMISGEKETGTLPMLLAQPLRLRALAIGKIATRVMLVFGCALGFSAIGFLLSGADLGSAATVRLLLWGLAVIIYGAFWFAIAAMVNAAGRGSAATALILAVAWLIFLFVVPSTTNFIAVTAYPIPPRVEYINAARAAEDRSRSKRKELVTRYLSAHPELRQYGWTIDNLGVGYPEVPEAMPEKIEAEDTLESLKPVVARYEGQFAGQQRVVGGLSFFSPAVLMQGVLYNLAGTGRDRHEHFLRQVNAFNKTWNDFFDVKPFRREMVNASDYERFPRFAYREESLREVVSRIIIPMAALLVMTTALFIFALRAFRRYAIVG